MTFRRLATNLSLLSLLACLPLVACSDEDEEEQEEEHAHGPVNPSCKALSDACHEADTGSGPAHDCHEVAHHDVEEHCAAELASCTETCEGGGGAGGTGG